MSWVIMVLSRAGLVVLLVLEEAVFHAILCPLVFAAFYELYMRTWNRLSLVFGVNAPLALAFVKLELCDALVYYGLNVKILGFHLSISPSMPSTCDAAKMVDPKRIHLPCLLANFTRLKTLVLNGPWEYTDADGDAIRLARTCCIVLIFFLAFGSAIALSPGFYPQCYGCGCRRRILHFHPASRGRRRCQLMGWCMACHETGAPEKTESYKEMV